MQLRKVILTIMASAAILGLEVNIQPTIHARHVRIYRVHPHRTYHKRNLRKAPKRNKRTREIKQIKRNRKVRKLHRSNRKHHGYRLAHKASKVRKLKRIRQMHRTRHITRHHGYRKARGLNKYIYNISGHILLQDMAQDNNMSIHNLLRRYSTNGKSIKAFDLDGALTPIAMAKSEAKDENEPFNIFFNMGDPGTGKLNQYDIQGSYMTLTPTQLKHEAANSDTSVSSLLSHDVYHPNKYVDGEGFLTKAGTKLAEQDAINDLNQIRENQGSQPMQEDPSLEFIAEKRADTMGLNLSHYDKSGNLYADLISSKYNVPYYGTENTKTQSSEPFSTPAQVAQVEQQQWDAGHRANREDPSNTKVGIGINDLNGNAVEEFE